MDNVAASPRVNRTWSHLSDRWFAAAVGVAGLLRMLFLYRLPEAKLVEYLPDDAFYYLQTARNFDRLGRWTFDGVEPASGFHVMWGYLVAAFFRFFPHASFHTVFAAGSVLHVACLAAGAYLLAATARRLCGDGALPGLVIVFFSAACVSQGTQLMESSLVIAATAAVLYLLLRPHIELTDATAAYALLLGFLVMTTRSDTGLGVFVLCVTLWLMHWRGQIDASVPWLATIVLAGSVLALIFTFVHTHEISGHWLQSSALEKSYWAQVDGKGSIVRRLFTSIYVGLSVFYPMVGSGHGLLLKLDKSVRVLLCVLLTWGLMQAARRNSQPAERGLLLGLVAMVASYFLFYSLDSGVQGWYIANFAAPLALLAGAAASYFTTVSPVVRVWTYGVAAGLAVVGLTVSLSFGAPWQEAMYQTGEYLHTHPEPHPVGAFNSGIIGYFADDGVVNLDGLVNDSVVPYSRLDGLAAYLAKRHIDTIADFPYMLYDPTEQRHGGYSEGQLLACLRSSKELFPNDPNNVWNGTHIELFEMRCERTPH